MKLYKHMLYKNLYAICKSYIIYENLNMPMVKDKEVNVYFNTFILTWLD